MANSETPLATAPATVRWTPEREPSGMSADAPTLPPMLLAIGRGLLCRCPVCGKSRLFTGYLTVVPVCPVCATPLGRVRADDAPPYFTIFVVGHIVVLGMLMLEQQVAPPLWVHAAIWLPLTAVLSLLLLRPIKGGTVGLMLKLGMLKDEDSD